jgi:hypothetical protein
VFDRYCQVCADDDQSSECIESAQQFLDTECDPDKVGENSVTAV